MPASDAREHDPCAPPEIDGKASSASATSHARSHVVTATNAGRSARDRDGDERTADRRGEPPAATAAAVGQPARAGEQRGRERADTP